MGDRGCRVKRNPLLLWGSFHTYFNSNKKFYRAIYYRSYGKKRLFENVNDIASLDLWWYTAHTPLVAHWTVEM